MTQTDTVQTTTDATDIEPFVVPLDPTEELVRSLVEPVIEGESCLLVHLQLVRGKSRSVLRLFLDTKGDGGIGIAELESLNRSLGDLLDVEDEHRGIFRGKYNLEVSSPGLDRPLAKRSHFVAAVGKKVRVRTSAKVAGARHHNGVLTHVEDDGFRVGDEREDGALIAWRDVADAHVVYEFDSPADKQRKGPKRDKRSKRRGKNDRKTEKTTEQSTTEEEGAQRPVEE